jgi:hypothetical protein
MESTPPAKKRQRTIDYFVNKKISKDKLLGETGPSDDSKSTVTAKLEEHESPADIAVVQSIETEEIFLHEEESPQDNPSDRQASELSERPGAIDISISKNDHPVRPLLQTYPMNDKNRRFSSIYFKEHDWIEYSVRYDAVYCYACRHFGGISLFKGGKEGKKAFIDVGFSKWKDMKALFNQHNVSARHRSSMVSWTEWKAISSKEAESIASRISTTRSTEILENRNHVKALLRATSFLGRQGLAFRGHDETETSDNKGNFVELMETLSEGDSNLKLKMERSYGHYMSHVYQND